MKRSKRELNEIQIENEALWHALEEIRETLNDWFEDDQDAEDADD